MEMFGRLQRVEVGLEESCMNSLMLSVGRRGELLKNFCLSMEKESKLVATDLSPYAPALYMADKQYLVPPVNEPEYIDLILDICRKENINVVTTFIDPEVEILAKNRKKFEMLGVEVLAPYEETAKLCFDKYLMFKFLRNLDADVYIDTITHEAVAAFSKKKIETRIGGASKTVAFKDEKLFDFIRQISRIFEFNGPVDMDFFYCDGRYYLSEINPRFGGAYLHAYGAGVDFVKLIENNLRGEVNEPDFGNYKEGSAMMMYDSVVIIQGEEVIRNE
jgi:hypothetical protein